MMTMHVNMQNGLIKVYWHDVSARVYAVSPTFASIVNALDPGRDFPLYLAYYPYGAVDADTESSFFPRENNTYYRVTDKDAPKEVVTDLGYSARGTPLGMVLDKTVECFIDLKYEGITIPWLIYEPGSIFPFELILNRKKKQVYAPNGLLSSTAGTRSAFMLPNIGCAIYHANLQRDFNIQSAPPKSLYEHGNLFKELLASEPIRSPWRCCIMYFSENWVNQILTNSSWAELKQYLHELAWNHYDYERNRIYYDIAFAMIQKKRNLKPNPYLADTVKHLFAIAIGAVPAFSPAVNDSALPFETIQQIFVESYGLKKYIPTVMHPTHFNFSGSPYPIYYSLQLSSTQVFSPKSREVSSTLFEMRELEHIIRIVSEELGKPNALCNDTILGEAAKSIDFDLFHNKADRHRIVQLSSEIPLFDKRFNGESISIRNKQSVFASDAPFVRGCIRMSKVVDDE